ncbi:MAG TPA: YdeI/OmpD-associated family protein [Gemmatimonadaceae bacterium]|jgi:uncharacterized protein YdeI (YjbR/CyaY-like superfamily)|nr:YdeI/OmpD-associated family protein [Gemmatimonadaceae bacterium]
MPPKNPILLDVASIGAWRRWLSRHHGSTSEIWLVFYKQQSGHPSLVYQDALDEALCFGWIDSLVKRVDDHRYARKFTPRKLGSNWSPSNRKRYAELESSGRLAAAGRARSPSRGKASTPAPQTLEIPQYFADGIARNRSAAAAFAALAPSHRRDCVHWVDSAKRDETKRRRLVEVATTLAAGRTLGLK